MTKEIHYDGSINSQNDVNYINQLINSVKDERDTCLTQDSRKILIL